MFKTQEAKALEVEIYNKIAKEIEGKSMEKGLWVKAKSEVGGNESATEARYIKLRFEQLKEESETERRDLLKKEEELQTANAQEEKRKKKLGAGFSAIVWVFSFIMIWSNLDWAKSFGFETDAEIMKSLQELFIYSIAHIVSIPFVLYRGVKIDRQKEELKGFKHKGIKSSFNIRLFLTIVFIGIIALTAYPMFTGQDNRTGTKVDILSVLKNQSDEINKTLPKMIDSETQMFLTFVSDDLKFNYEYILVNLTKDEIDISVLQGYLESELNKEYCTNEGLKTFREENVSVVWNFYSKDKVKVLEVEQNINKCLN